MAATKINVKTKSKEDKTKINKGPQHLEEDADEIDFSILRKPILTSISGFAQARKIFDLATEELKHIITDECDLLYECKVCRNIFRSLANFLSHKRVFCKDKFSFSKHGHFIKATSLAHELLKIKKLEEGYQESLNVTENSCMDTDNDANRIPISKDLTTIVELLTKQKGISNNKIKDIPQVVLHKMPSTNNAVFQSVLEDKDDNMQTQVKELDSILSQDKAVLQSDGKFTVECSSKSGKSNHEADGVIQISDDDEESDALKCKICDLQFSTQKTLKFHMKYKHLESRLVYPCPDCIDIFSTSWSVYRHLFKVHRKTAAQIRRLRESIQSKAFRMNNPPAFYEKRKNNNMKTLNTQKVTEEERLDQENQAWMDNMEGDSELPRCGGCGRMFERRAALAAHTHTCQPRSRALARRPIENKKIEIQIRKDYNKGSSSNTNLNLSSKSDTIGKSINEDSIQDAAATNENNNEFIDKCIEDKQDIVSKKGDICDDKEVPNDINKTDECQNITENILETLNECNMQLPFSEHIEQRNLAALKKKMEMDVELDTFNCKKCNTLCADISDLCKHMAEHFKWNRYGCKLCNFKNYMLGKLPEHIKTVHKLRGDNEFYYSTVKALDPIEAMSNTNESIELNESTSTSPVSRRPSRCSSDSSRQSDNDSSSSNPRGETPVNNRKRKMNPTMIHSKKKKEITLTKENKGDDNISLEKVVNVIFSENDNSKDKGSEENSSDVDEIDEKNIKRSKDGENKGFLTATTRRPVRKRSKPKNDDFEYDLSNLLKMEAQGYRDSQINTNSRINQTKKRNQIDIHVDAKEYSGALFILSKKSVEKAQSHMKQILINTSNSQSPRDQRGPSIFVKPSIPRIQNPKTSNEKNSPKKGISEEIKETSPNTNDKSKSEMNHTDNQIIEHNKEIKEEKSEELNNSQEHAKTELKWCETIKTKLNIPAVVPIKLRRQSLDVIKNPIINKNITDFSKAGMKTKILVIKPISRKDRVQSVNTPIKFQTIKLKESTNEITTKDENNTKEQVKFVKIPPVEQVSKVVTETCVADKIVETSNNTKNLSNEKLIETNTNVTNSVDNTDK